MPAATRTPSRPSPLYLAECRYGRLGHAFRETDRDSNSRAEIIDLMRTGEIEAIKVLEIDEVEGTCRDVTLELQLEVSAMMVEAA
ncbi:MAG TPA: hypothetical protein VEU47_11065 [Candidatus Cybelea sp.]|nr:hypothetical protein [Candidatus Cybelea sp.]